MTAKKDLKQRVRERQAKTGERYTTALAQVRSKAKRGRVEISEARDLSCWAELEGFHCRAVASEGLWDAECALGAPAERFRAVFVRLRALLLALESEDGAADLCAALLRGERREVGNPNAVQELAESRRFLSQVRSGARGLSRNGRLVAFDVPQGGGQVTLVGVFMLEGHRPLLWLSTLGEHQAALSKEIGAGLAQQLALAGIGGLGVTR